MIGWGNTKILRIIQTSARTSSTSSSNCVQMRGVMQNILPRRADDARIRSHQAGRKFP
jgi:hypothetical protein